MKINPKNELVKKKYLDLLKNLDGLSEATINSISGALCKYDDFSNCEDYRLISPNKVLSFKEWLLTQQHRCKPVSVKTVYYALRHIRSFFKWLSGESGYRSKNLVSSVSYLRLDKNRVREANATTYVDSPTLDYVKQLVNSIEPVDEICMRDRALIAFLLLSGIRDLAAATLPIVCFDRSKFLIHQDPTKGVLTKNRKTIHSRLLKIDPGLFQIVLDWYDFLVTEKQFKPTDPMFPQTKYTQPEDGFSFKASGVEPEFWCTASPIRKILRDRSRQANLPYFKPHTFRHANTRIGWRYCKSPQDIRALSQNLGHEDIGTTLKTYGKLDTHEALEIVANLDFSSKPMGNFDKNAVDKLIEILLNLKNETN